jgi:hypothetical protein
VTWNVQPEPTDENERRALLVALEQALVEDEVAGEGYASAWWRAGLEDLGGGARTEQPWRDPGVVEP